MLVKEYVEGLYRLNEHVFYPLPSNRSIASISFGLIEEILEFECADYNFDALVAEAGDVLAYVTMFLLCEAAGKFRDDDLRVQFVASALGDVDNKVIELPERRDIVEVACKMAGNMKRLYREGRVLTPDEVVSCLIYVLAELNVLCRALCDIKPTFAIVSQHNLSKLNDRARRGLLYQGSGDKR